VFRGISRGVNTLKTELLQELRKGAPLAEIRRKFRSQSQLYEALREYLEETEKTVDIKRRNLQQVEDELSEAKHEISRIDHERSIISERVTKAETQLKGLLAEVKRAAEKMGELVAAERSLTARGFSSEIMKKLSAIDAKSGEEFIRRVETAKKYTLLKKEFSILQKNRGCLKYEIGTLNADKRNIQEMVASEKNMLDELRVQTACYKETMDAVDTFLKAGYDSEDIKSLIKGLEVFGIKGDPRASLSRLVTGLKEMKTLFAVEEKLDRKNGELATLTEAVAYAKSELKTIEQTVLQAFREALNTSVQAIKSTEKQANSQIQQAAEEYKVELEKIAELEHRKTEIEQFLVPGQALIGILASPQYLKSISAPFMMQFLNRIQRWFEMNYPSASTIATTSIHAKEYNLVPSQSYNLAALVELANEGLKQLTMG
jgi:hypothetical protein